MFESIQLKSSTLREIFADLNMLIPAGVSTIPVGLACDNYSLTFTHTGTCNYQNSVEVSEPVSREITVIYTNIRDLIESGQMCTIEFQNNGIMLKCGAVTTFLRVAYSAISKFKVNNIDMETVLATTPSFNLVRRIVKTQLPTIYKKEQPVTIFNEVALMKYQNIWVQTRATGMRFQCTFTQDCLRKLITFEPSKFAKYSDDTILVSRGNALLFIPVKFSDGLQNITELIPTGVNSVRFELGRLGEKLKILKLVNAKSIAFTLLEKGLKLQGDSAENSVSISLGDSDSAFTAGFRLPTNLGLMCLQMFSEGVVEMIYKEGVLCMRNSELVIVVRVLA